MALPQIATESYTCTLPSTGEEIQYRPFRVGEQRLLLMANESGEEKEMFNALIKVLETCTENVKNVKKLSTFDLEYLFLQIRSKSVGETVEFETKCTEEDCDESIKVEFDLSTIEPEAGEGHNKVIQLTDSIGLQMKYLDIDFVLEEAGGSSDVEFSFKAITESIEVIYDGDEVFKVADETKEEVQRFLDSLSDTHLKEINKFIDTTPKLRKTIEWECPNGHANKNVFEGLNDFFGLGSSTSL